MIKVKKIRPMFTSLITTMNKYEEDTYDGGIIDTSKQRGELKEYQKVVAIGDSVRSVKVGDLVKINPTRFLDTAYKEKKNNTLAGKIDMVPEKVYRFDVVEMNNTDYLLLQDRDIDFIIEEYEEIPDTPKSKKIIVPNKPKLIV